VRRADERRVVAGRFFIARHGETVFNAVSRMQGDAPHTPLTRTGFAQADEMGALLRVHLGPKPKLDLWSSPSGRALQTLAVIAEHLELDWHGTRIDDRLREIDIGEWGGRYYHDVAAEDGPVVDRAAGLFIRRPPGGEYYDDVAARLQSWLDDVAGETPDRLIVMHGMSSRVLRGLLTGAPERTGFAAPIADGIRQGSLVEIRDGAEQILEQGDAFEPF
jgi:probable phosphoglycerate mutase